MQLRLTSDGGVEAPWISMLTEEFVIAHHPESCLSQFRQYSLEPSAQLTESQQQGQTESKTVFQYKLLNNKLQKRSVGSVMKPDPTM